MKSFLLISIAALCLSGCETEQVPVVKDKNAKGEFEAPTCPKCGKKMKAIGTVYLDDEKHTAVSWF